MAAPPGAAPAASPGLFEAERPGAAPAAVAPPRVVSTDSRVLFEALDGIFAALGLGALGDEAFWDLILARVVEPASILDADRVLADLGRKAASDKTMRRTLARCAERGHRDTIDASRSAARWLTRNLDSRRPARSPPSGPGRLTARVLAGRPGPG